MKRQLLLGVAVGALAAVNSAFAADLPVKAPASAPIVAAYNWTGCYVGGNIGYGWARARSDVSAPDVGSLGIPTIFSASQDLNGVIGGGQIGCNWRMSDSWIWGLETDFQGSGQKSSTSFNDPFSLSVSDGEGNTTTTSGAVNQTLEARIRWFGTLRARVGVLITPTLLFYGTGGLAYGNVRVTDAITVTSIPATTTFSQSSTRVGWTIGGGVEGAFPNSTNWTWKIEYLYVDLGSLNGAGVDPLGGAVNWSTTVTDNIVRVGVNYRFH